MAIKHLTYKSIPRERRQQQAARAMGKMREMLHLNPLITDEQRQAVEGKAKHLQKWVNGDLDPGEAPVLAKDPKPKHHKVVVEEELGIDESVDKDKEPKD
jgi:hypothetical protein